MWSALWDTIEDVTGKPVKFKFLHGEGIKAICVDGNKPQIQGCGDDLIRRNDPSISGVYDRDPQMIVTRIVRTCFVHLDRYFTLLLIPLRRKSHLDLLDSLITSQTMHRLPS